MALLGVAENGIWYALLDILILLGTAMALGAVAERLRQNAIVGYVLAGMLVGPSALGWVTSQEGIFGMAEMGVALLLFAIGLEFSPRRLLSLGRVPLIAGPLQVLVTVVAGAAACRAWGLPGASAVVMGSLLSALEHRLRVAIAERPCRNRQPLRAHFAGDPAGARRGRGAADVDRHRAGSWRLTILHDLGTNGGTIVCRTAGRRILRRIQLRGAAALAAADAGPESRLADPAGRRHGVGLGLGGPTVGVEPRAGRFCGRRPAGGLAVRGPNSRGRATRANGAGHLVLCQRRDVRRSGLAGSATWVWFCFWPLPLSRERRA